ncbi:Aste57867_21014 [Aphanomyces stellatus]|uniref:Aste57867_21014 protein n=1 Tax=Aphanomyces stellatus TaxID=120398 RepID=A0A485LL50_9STRA|nr:hypothetical protein As57867_020946 [Aphanomyces stellatus]VFT97689.1 Aste57867_21014 [Aphanomyces stellatus]
MTKGKKRLNGPPTRPQSAPVVRTSIDESTPSFQFPVARPVLRPPSITESLARPRQQHQTRAASDQETSIDDRLISTTGHLNVANQLIRELRSELSYLHKTQAEAQRQLHESKTKLDLVNAQDLHTKSELTEVNRLLQDTTIKLDAANRAVVETRAELAREKRQVASSNALVDLFKEKFTTARKSANETKNQLDVATRQVKSFETNAKTATTRIKSLETEIANLRTKIARPSVKKRAFRDPMDDWMFEQMHQQAQTSKNEKKRQSRAEWPSCQTLLCQCLAFPVRAFILVPFLAMNFFMAALQCILLAVVVGIGIGLVPLCCCGCAILLNLPSAIECFIPCDLSLIAWVGQPLSTHHSTLHWVGQPLSTHHSTLHFKAVVYYGLIKLPHATLTSALSFGSLFLAWSCITNTNIEVLALQLPSYLTLCGWSQLHIAGFGILMVYISVGIMYISTKWIRNATKFFTETKIDSLRFQYSRIV